jgi:hypothetical protein
MKYCSAKKAIPNCNSYEIYLTCKKVGTTLRAGLYGVRATGFWDSRFQQLIESAPINK